MIKMNKELIEELDKIRLAVSLLKELKLMIKQYKHADLISEINDIIYILENGKED